MRVLATGVITWDIVLGVAGYPAEDSKSRALWQRQQRGGNAANTLAVLSTAGHRCELLAVLPEGAAAEPLVHACRAEGIGYAHCPRLPGAAPTSYILQNEANGSRTIVHHRPLPELAYAHVAAVLWGGFDWLHCEGRQPEVTARLLAAARAGRSALRCSVELEKPQAGLEVLLPFADTIFYARHYAQNQGYAQGADFLRDQARHWPHAALFCAWGEQGAYAHVAGRGYFQPAIPVDPVVESTGAGDVFNAAVIHALGGGATPEAALRLGCCWAAAKCAQRGFSGIGAE